MSDDNNNQELPISNDQIAFSKPKKSKKTLYFIILGVIVFVLAVAGTVVFLLLNNKKDDTTKVDEPSASMAYVKSFLSSPSADSGITESVSESKNTSNDVLYKLQESSWIAADPTANVTSFSSKSDKAETNKISYDSIVERLKTDGFTEISSLDYSTKAYDLSEMYVQYFASDTIVCNLRYIPGPVSEPPINKYVTKLSCASMEDFDTNKTAMTPYAKAYAISDKRLDQDVLLSSPEPQDSANENYKNAMLNLTVVSTKDISVAEFYQIPDGSWNFFAVTKDRDNINCSDYSSDDMIKAFTGFICFDNVKGESSFVQMPQPEPSLEVVPGGSGG